MFITERLMLMDIDLTEERHNVVQLFARRLGNHNHHITLKAFTTRL